MDLLSFIATIVMIGGLAAAIFGALLVIFSLFGRTARHGEDRLIRVLRHVFMVIGPGAFISGIGSILLSQTEFGEPRDLYSGIFLAVVGIGLSLLYFLWRALRRRRRNTDLQLY